MAQLARLNTMRELARMQEEMDRWSGGWLPREALETTFAGAVWTPPVNIAETKDNYVIAAELPGLTKDDIKVTYDAGVLSIQGERKQEKEEKDKTWHRIERGYGLFERSFRLPMTVEAEKINAEFKDGVLTLTLPKLEAVKPKQIAIKVN